MVFIKNFALKFHFYLHLQQSNFEQYHYRNKYTPKDQKGPGTPPPNKKGGKKKKKHKTI